MLLSGLSWLALLASAATSSPDPVGTPLLVRPAQSYTLTDRSQYQEGCFAPCMCPIMLHEGLDGGFTLKPQGTDGNFDVFQVRNAKWITPVSFGGGPLRAYGWGVYRIDRAARLQRLELDLMLEGRGRERFDSGLVPVAVDFPAISVAIAMNDFYCWDTAFDLDAQPEAHGELPGLPVEAPGAEVLGAPQPPTSWGTVKALYDDGR